MPATTSTDLITSTKLEGSNETHDGYKTWMNEVILWANNHDMACITKIAKRLQEAPSFRSPVSRAPPLGEKFLDEAHAAREELLAEIHGSVETDAGAEPAEGQQADEVTFGHKMAFPAEYDRTLPPTKDLASLLR